jgi:hypothetical protein
MPETRKGVYQVTTGRGWLCPSVFSYAVGVRSPSNEKAARDVLAACFLLDVRMRNSAAFYPGEGESAKGAAPQDRHASPGSKAGICPWVDSRRKPKRSWMTTS